MLANHWRDILRQQYQHMCRLFRLAWLEQDEEKKSSLDGYLKLIEELAKRDKIDLSV